MDKDPTGDSLPAVIDAARTAAALPFAELIPALKTAFAAGASVPPRHHHSVPQADGAAAVLLLMPAWQGHGGYLGVKIVSIYSGNAGRGLPGLYSTYLLCDYDTGRPLALLDGNQITIRRTVAVAALAADYLACADASSLLLVGAGRVASLIAPAMREVRPVRDVSVWDIDPAKAEALAVSLREQGFTASAATSLPEAVARAQIVSCATLSQKPLVQAEWLSPGTHLDLIGSFTPQMREADDACFARGRVFVDSPGALTESGDLADPIRLKILDSTTVGTLEQLCTGAAAGRRDQGEITIFKSVGTALSDITAGGLAFRNVRATEI
jgi:ornithine cyclodeaminase/alanine dehydrogenase-like protein (mu-crystallin family)